MNADPLGLFDPAIAAWFRERYGQPTRVQTLAWPRIAAGEHVLLTAETGSGKTLAAFLWALDRLLRGVWAAGQIRVLYVSPLRALNSDIGRNLVAPLQALSRRLPGAPPIEVAIRSGDTPETDRRRMLRRPPEILITTPESLNLLLTSRAGQTLFTGLRAVLLDEVHALAESKRGTHLMTAIERLTLQAGEFQRVALSATVRPLEAVARFVGGFALGPRPVAIAVGTNEKRIDLRISYPALEEPGPSADDGDQAAPIWSKIASEVARRVGANRTTLIFANSRRGVERLARLVSDAGVPVYAHHGSLSRELRQGVEARLREGTLRGVVATSSLELGIDIGVIDEVILVQTPPSVASAVQRIGRAGHQVGAVSRATLLALSSLDLLWAAVSAEALLEGDVEPIRPPVAPLDVLAQVILSMCVAAPWNADQLYDFLHRSAPYRDLDRAHFDRVIELLTGRFDGDLLKALKPRLARDAFDNTLRARPGALAQVLLSGGTIPERGQFNLRLAESSALVGTLDEEFVWERKIGDTFSLGVQTWRIERITASDVLVSPAGRARITPFWRSEERYGRHHLAARLGAFLASIEARLGASDLAAELAARCRLDAPAAEALCAFLERQRAALGGLPHRGRLILERVRDPRDPAKELTVLHTVWGGRVNRPLGLLLKAVLGRAGREPEIDCDDLCVVVSGADPLAVEEALPILAAEPLRERLAEELGRTGTFGAAFREALGRALLLPRATFRRRTPLFVLRERAQAILQAVGADATFPIVLEALRACLDDALELEPLERLLGELGKGEIALLRAQTATPSPFAAEAIWKRTNRLMYADDTPATEVPKASIRSAFAGEQKPGLPRDLLEEIRAKITRTHVGYSPSEPAEVIELLKERLVCPAGEWQALLAALERDHGLDAPKLEAAIASRAVRVQLRPGEEPVVVALERLACLEQVLGPVESVGLDGQPIDPAALEAARGVSLGPDSVAQFVWEWQRAAGPTPVAVLEALLPLEPETVRGLLESLAAEERIELTALEEGSAALWAIERETYERLLQIGRARTRRRFRPCPAADLGLLWAELQGLGQKQSGVPLDRALALLSGLPAPAPAWEGEILPARIAYRPEQLDGLFAAGGPAWFGAGGRAIAFADEGDLDLFLEQGDSADPALEALLPEHGGRFTLADLVLRTSRLAQTLALELWHYASLGRITCDSFHAVRRRLASDRTPAPAGPEFQSSRRRRRQSLLPGAWRRLRVEPCEDALDEEERDQERVRILLARYGVLSRPILARELAPLRFGALFRAMFRMELAGEIVAGHFLEGHDHLQFASPAALQRLAAGLDRERVYWLAAADPASPCGLGLKGLPPRLWTTHIVFRGTELLAVSRRRGQDLTLRLAPDDPVLPRLLDPLAHLLTRAVRPLPAIAVAYINGAPAALSPYREALQARFDTERDGPSLRLTRRFEAG